MSLCNFVMLNGSFFLTRSLGKILAFVFQSNVNATACKVIENGARVCLVKYQIVIIEFCVTY